MRMHFIGIGGIGVSALAQYYLAVGHEVSGSDLTKSEITDLLAKKGAKIIIGKHKKSNAPKNIDLVIYSPAVPQNNSELKEAKKSGIKSLSYPEALGELTKQYFTIAVSGTHGKSTTTAMIGLLLTKAGLDPTVILGTKLKEFGNTNCRVGHPVSRLGESRPEGAEKPVRQARGKIQYLVIEADEHFASFLDYWPRIIVLTNIEKDHLDYYKNLNNILRTFREYIKHLPGDGILIANKDDKNSRKAIGPHSRKAIFYSLKQPGVKKIKKILRIPGEHNVSNALAALAVGRILKIPDKISFKALSEYQGSWRRFEEKDAKIENRKIKIISDYGHHPTEIRVTLEAARQKYPQKQIWCVFQPHQYQRTYYLFNDFVKVFRSAPIDKIIITDIYDVAGREEKKIREKINSKKMVEAIDNPRIIYIPSLDGTKHYLAKNLSGKEILVVMGAGDVYKIISNF